MILLLLTVPTSPRYSYIEAPVPIVRAAGSGHYPEHFLTPNLMLFLKNTPINQILSIHEMIEAIEDTLKEVAVGRGFELPRRRIHHANRMIFGLLPGSVHGVMGAYLQTDLDRRIHHETVAEKLGSELKIPVHVVASAEEALEGADIVITATDSSVPVFDGNRLSEGTHITSIANGDKTRTRQELDEITIRRANPIFVTSKETLCVNESDIFRAVRDRLITWDQVHEMSSLLLGKVHGRTHDQQITLFKLQGTGIMDVAIGLRAFEKLKDSNLAQPL